VTLLQLKRIRWGVRATLALGVLVSTVANVLHAVDNPISQAIAAWPPVALLLTVELISRIPVHARWLAGLRMVAAAVIAGIAAWVSYWHMVGVAARYGETGASPYLLPVSVDGLIVVASICLVELADRIRTLTPATEPAPATDPADRPDNAVDRTAQSADDGTATALPWRLAPAIPLAQFAAQRHHAPALAAVPAAGVLAADESSSQLNGHHNTPAAGSSSGSPDDADDADPVLSAARTVADDLVRHGRRVTRDALAAGLRARGVSISTDRATALARELSAAADSQRAAA
jgi:hypothetical protein